MNHDAKHNLIIKIAKYLFLLLLFVLPFCAKAGTVTLGSSVKATSIEVLSGSTLDVNGSNTVTLTGSGSPFDVQGTFICSTSTVSYEGIAATTIASLSADNHYYNLTLGAVNDNNTLVFTINGEIEASGSMTITSGGTGTHTFSQGNYNITVEGASAISVQVNAQWRNIGNGDLVLGGSFDNTGSVSFDTNDSECTNVADEIQILSTVNGTQRTWSGTTGTWNMYNVYVKDMTRTDSPNITVYEGSSSNVTGNWTFATCVANQAPTIGEVSLGTYPRGAGSITLLEGTDIEIVASAQVDDNDTCADISGAKAYVYRRNQSWAYGTGATCSFDYNNCYTPNFGGGVLDCVQQSCAGNTAIYDCTASAYDEGGDGMWYHADPTDDASSNSSEWWEVMIIASDSVMNDVSATNSTETIDVNLLAALDIGNGSDSIAYGTISPGNESSPVLERGIKNTGNRGVDITIKATTALEISGGGENIASEQQQYFLSSSIMGDGTSLSGTTAAELDVVLPKPTSHTAGANDDQIFWGIAIPPAASLGSYTGQTTYTTVSD